MKLNAHEIVSSLIDDSITSFVEIGVFRGDLMFFLLDKHPNISKYYAVDTWKLYPEFEKILTKRHLKKHNYENIYDSIVEKSEDYDGRILIRRMTSIEASKEDTQVDFIYIDANHSYDYVVQDIDAWLPHLKGGGIISGHDYGNPRFQVTEAVNDKFSSFEHKGEVWWVRK